MTKEYLPHDHPLSQLIRSQVVEIHELTRKIWGFSGGLPHGLSGKEARLWLNKRLKINIGNGDTVSVLGVFLHHLRRRAEPPKTIREITGGLDKLIYVGSGLR
jgi:hypothetical protein